MIDVKNFSKYLKYLSDFIKGFIEKRPLFTRNLYFKEIGCTASSDRECMSLQFYFKDYGSLYVAMKDGLLDEMRDVVVDGLREWNYASVVEDKTIDLVFDCYENVKRHYGGNYFYRDLDGCNQYAIVYREIIGEKEDGEEHTKQKSDSSGKPMTKRNLLLWALNVPKINAFTTIDSQKIKALLQKWKGYIPS